MATETDITEYDKEMRQIKLSIHLAWLSLYTAVSALKHISNEVVIYLRDVNNYWDVWRQKQNETKIVEQKVGLIFN